MLKFFRTIRRKLLVNNKIGQYLKYALGEIFLVVVGILIALQINNWNEDRKDRSTEIQTLNSILNNLKEDEANLNFSIESFELSKKYIERMYNIVPIPKDSVAFLFSQAYLINDFTPITTAFDLSVSSGRLDLIKDKKLAQRIQRLYTLDYKVADINMVIFKEYHTQMRHLTDNFDALDFGKIRGSIFEFQTMQMPFNVENVLKLIGNQDMIRINKQYIFNADMISIFYRAMLLSRNQVEQEIEQYLETMKN